MKKKTVSLLLVAAMAVGMFAGCGGGKSSISQDGSSDTAEGNEKVEMADEKGGRLKIRTNFILDEFRQFFCNTKFWRISNSSDGRKTE